METDKEWRFNRQEFAGSLGNLGTILPIGIALIEINGLNATAVLFSLGLFYVLSGLYFRIPVPVEPMKVIGAYAIAMSMSPLQITAAGLWMGIGLLVLAFSGAMTLVGRIVPQSTIRGVQLTTGILLLSHGVQFMLGTAKIQKLQNAAEPYLSVQSIGMVPIGIILGIASIVTILLLIENKRLPATILVIAGGATIGLLLGANQSLLTLHPAIHFPPILPFGLPSASDFVIALTVLALPQLPMTVGNAIVAQADLAQEYFGAEKAAKTTHRALSVSMGLANILCSLIGAMPLCHGAGGLAAHYRFGARTAGASLMIGAIFLVIAVFIGDQAAQVFSLLPFSVLGALLVFAGAQIALTIMDVKERKDFFVIFLMLGIALASNLAVGFVAGFAVAYLLKNPKLNV
jgi:SulP family sulfate permease